MNSASYLLSFTSGTFYSNRVTSAMTSSCPGIDPLPSEFRFFKIIVDTTLQKGKIMIPKEFTRKYGGRLLNPLFLKVPDGIEWELCWTKDGTGNVWLEKGWKEFATYYSLGYGHLVTFKYQQTCTLEVHIYNTCAVEINYPSNNTQNSSSNVLFEVAPTSPSLPGLSKKPRKHPIGPGSSLPQHVQVKVDLLQENSGATRSETPSFMVTLKDTNVNGYILVIPSIFTKKYLKETGKQDILLQVLDGRTWHVTLKNGKFFKGWRAFVSHNYLNVGDVCIFELTESQAPCFKVSIIPISQDKCSSSQDREYVDLTKIQDFRCIDTFSIKAMQEAAKFTSVNPFFTLKIRANHRGDFRSRVPLDFVREYFHKKQVTLQFGNKSWRVKLVGAVPTKLSQGWSPFAKECKLQPGNVCVFELTNEEDLVLDVHIFRGQS
ncbi:B3 domain-containing protein [Vigna angularis]|uniref:B3 domain-containing protein n=1 Tax=Phaseolus angularis TaxID=3914 RepID=A0A8T0KMP8_PHAAN|nr:B3 domain-containing transcription factor VRN1 isoform X2 [Vigna angularis]KAG2401327.1 B3 domain-containing protein [Vigna angularis]